MWRDIYKIKITNSLKDLAGNALTEHTSSNGFLTKCEKNYSGNIFVSGGFVEVNPEKCIVLAEGVDEMKSLDKNNIEKEMQDLEGQDSEDSKQQLSIVRAKIAALNSSHYEKI